MKRFYLQLIILFSVIYGASAVEIIPNSVYRLKNNTGRYLTVSANNAVTAADNPADNKQEWYFVANEDYTAYYMRNVQSGAYLTSPNSIYITWTLSHTTNPTDAMAMVFADKDNGYIVFHSMANRSNMGHAHNDASNNVVCWDSNASNTWWTIEHVEKTTDQIEDILDQFENIGNELANTIEYEKYLDNLFTDKSYTTLKDRNLDLDTNEDYLALSTRLKRMVKKIKTGTDAAWDEKYTYDEKEYAWDGNYVKRYRVQLYEPYSEGSDAAFMSGIQPHTNMNNPTGIVGDKDELIYIMVKDEIPAGATLYINEVPDCGMYNGTTSGIQLHRGLNTLLCNNNNSHFFIYYTVNTADKISSSMQHTKNNLKSYDPITIHIEGGRINGFFDYIGDELYGHDTEEQFLYTLERATHPMYDFLGRYVIMHMHLHDTPKKDGMTELLPCVRTLFTEKKNEGTPGYEYDPVKIVKAWDEMCLTEKVLMGITSDAEIADPYNLGMYETIVDSNENFEAPDGTVYSLDPGFYYNEYFNNRMMAISMQGDLFMNSTYYRTAYNVTTIESILVTFCDGNIWGPAHEYGHNNQDPIKIAGTTEVSNNIFSNVATFYRGKYTSRTDYLTNQFNIFLQNKTFLEHGTWGTTRMYWQLWCYYHACGKNKKFYPRLFELLRNHPLKHSTIPNEHRDLYDKMQFVKMCCIAAGEDLTNFFESWGFFVPLDGYVIGDYSTYRAYLTQDEIDAVKSEIKSYHFPVNNSIILIDDRPGLKEDPQNKRESYPSIPMEQGGSFGGLNDFRNNSNPEGNFGYTVKGNTVTISVEEGGYPGVGYLIWDSKGNLLGFANTNIFNVNSDLASKLISGEATVQAVGADNQTTVEVVNLLLNGTAEQKKAILSDLIDDTDDYEKYVDPTETKVGYILPEAFNEFMEFVDKTKEDTQNETDGAKLTAAIQAVTEKLSKLLTNEESLVGIYNDYTYEIENLVKSGNNKFYLSSNGISAVAKSTENISGSEGKSRYEHEWLLEKRHDNIYYIYNPSYNKYLEATTEGFRMSLTPAEFKLVQIPNKPGTFTIVANGANADCVTRDGYSLVISTGNTNAGQWTITKKTPLELATDRIRVGTLLELAAKLIDVDFNEYWWKKYEEGDNVAWSDLFIYMENELTPERKKYENILTNEKTTSEQLEESEKGLYALLKDVAEHIEMPFGSLSFRTANDRVDDSTDETVVRQVFNASSNGDASIVLQQLIISDNSDFNLDDFDVTVIPVSGASWAFSDALTQEELDAEYQRAFNEAAPEAGLYIQYQSLESKRVDGFFTSATCRIEDGGTDQEGNELYNVVVDVPCSGVYEVSFRLKEKGYLLLNPGYTDPWFRLEVYPNLVNFFGTAAAFNIDGVTFVADDTAHEKTLTLPRDFEPQTTWDKCNAYIPGTYFVNDFRITVEEVDETETPGGEVGKTESVAENFDVRRSVKRKNEGYVSTTDASVYYSPIDLSALEAGKKVKTSVYVTKNGADANYTFYVTREALLPEVSGTITVEQEGDAVTEKVIYYDLNGIRINNPTHGLYIKSIPGQPSQKIILK